MAVPTHYNNGEPLIYTMGGKPITCDGSKPGETCWGRPAIAIRDHDRRYLGVICADCARAIVMQKRGRKTDARTVTLKAIPKEN